MPALLTTEQFIKKARNVHGDAYDYSFVEYVSARNKVRILCKHHGEFLQEPNVHCSAKSGCPKCGTIRAWNKTTKSSDQFIHEARMVHGNKYNYSRVIYRGAKKKVEILCLVHGPFIISPNSHVSGGNGCPACGIITRNTKTTFTTEKFVQNAKKVHGDLYDYSEVLYKGIAYPVVIICKVHGKFQQLPVSHVNAKSGCPKCASNVSKQETSWLNLCGVPDTVQFRQVCLRVCGIRYKVDGFIPDTNTVYEFWGDFWHGNPHKYDPTDINPATLTTYGELYQNTLSKRHKILEAGYNLVEIWESEWANEKHNKLLEEVTYE